MVGEAKRRKDTDPNYGHVLQGDKERGLVISAPMEIEGTRLHLKSTHLDKEELRFSLLFFDRLVWPRTPVSWENNPDEEFLQSVGIIKRPEVPYHGEMAKASADGQLRVYRHLERSDPGRWALAEGEKSLLLKSVMKEELAESGSGALIELHRAIPIPKGDVPLAEILEFKERRRDELLRLRHHIESFISEMQSAEDKESALQKHVKVIDEACADLLSLGKEWQFPVYLSNLKATFSLSPTKFLPAVAGGWKLAEGYGLPTAATVAGIAGAASTLEVKADYGLRSIKRPITPYAYAYRMHQELPEL